MFEMIQPYVSEYSGTLILIFAMALCVYVVYIMEKMSRPPCRITEGFKHAKTLFENISVCTAIEELDNYVDSSRAFGTYSDFDKGIDKAIKQTVDNEIDELNAGEGGDWYFCRNNFEFRDSLTDRVKVL
jgi:hypothetical protein